MSKRVRTLLRVSSKQQLHNDDIPIQRGELSDFISKQEDWEFDREYIEKAVSAYKNGVEDRKVLQEIMEDAKAKEFDILLTYMSDRIGRQEEYSFYVHALNQLGIEVWTIKDGQLKTEEHVDKLLNYIRFWQNEGESKKTGTRVRDALKELVKEGRYVGGKAPYGYELVFSGQLSNKGRALKKLQIVDSEAEVVRKIFYLAVYKGMGYLKIANTLNAENIPNPNNSEWKYSTIASILKNPVYMGYVAYNRRVNHGSFTRLDRKDWIYAECQNPEITIIEPELWERAQEIREARKNRLAKTKQGNSDVWEKHYNYPFSTKGKLCLMDLAYCGYCGRRLRNGSYCNRWTVKSTGEEKMSFVGRYTCPTIHKERRSYSQNYLEGIVLEVVEEYMENLKNIDIAEELSKMQATQKNAVDRELKSIQKEQQTLRNDIQTLEEKIPEALRGDGYFSAEQLAKLISDKKSKLDTALEKEREIKRKIGHITVQGEEMEQFINSIPNWKEEFQCADTATKRMILASIIDKIEVRDDDIKIKFKIRLEDFLPKTISSDKIP